MKSRTIILVAGIAALAVLSFSHMYVSRPAPAPVAKVSVATPQFVLFSFDGSESLDMLNETLAFEQKMQTETKPIHFTYFINAAYFLTQYTASVYQAPEGPRGVSRIGFSNSTHDIALRVQGFNAAFRAGNEIGSHSVGHFTGALWTYDQWKQEFDSFTTIMANVQKNNPSEKIDAPVFLSIFCVILYRQNPGKKRLIHPVLSYRAAKLKR